MTPKARELAFVDALFHLSFLLQRILAKVAARHELSLIQIRLLGILRDREPGMLELARYLELEKSSLSGLVDRAERRGLVERVPSQEDGRAFKVRVTPQGRKLVRAIEEEASTEILKLTRELSRGDRTRLATLVDRIIMSDARL